MVKTRSSVVSARSFASSAPTLRSCSSSSTSAPRKRRRRRTVSMPERKKKLRRRQALKSNVAIAKALCPEVNAENGSKRFKNCRNSSSKQNVQRSNPSNTPSPKSTRKSFSLDHSPAPKCSQEASKPRSAATDRKPETRRYSGTGERKIQNASPQTTCKKVSFSGEVAARETECNSHRVMEVNHANHWTSEDDSALQNAYFHVLPSSNFWFEVSKKVPGKNAKDCFDRFYSVHPTPPTTQPRSRKLAAESPVRTISFLSPKSSLNSKVRFARGKQGLLKAHQTVRHILRQQRVADGAYEADVFKAVEQVSPRIPLPDECTNRASSPVKVKETSFESLLGTPMSCFGDLKSEVSSKRPRSAPVENIHSTRSALKSQFSSPEVLKPELNPSRLDRFLDILHLRQVEKRRNPSSGKGNSHSNQGNPKAERTFTQCIAAAREAIISDATEILRTAAQQQAATVEEEDQIEEEGSLLSEE